MSTRDVIITNRLYPIEGGQKMIHTPKGVFLRRVWVDDEGKYSIQINRDMPEVTLEVINNTEIYRLASNN